MAKTATVTTLPKKLTPFDGRDVLSAGVEIRNAAGGLNEAMNVDPAEYHKDEEIVVAIRCTVRDIDFRPIKDTDGWRRVHVLHATEATIIDDEIVDDALDAQAKRIEEAAGIQRLNLDGDDTGE